MSLKGCFLNITFLAACLLVHCCLTSHGHDRVVSMFEDDIYPFQNVSLPWKTRVDNLVSLLTLEEIQLQMARGGHGPDVSPAPAIPRLKIGPYSWNTECLSGVVNAGTATSFPEALGMAASFSPNLLFRVARAVGYEARAKYNNYTATGVYGDSRGLSCFSPVINIMRDPRWGRNQETYGEDPVLTSYLATSFVEGLQGDDDRYVLANAGCKHFDVHGGPENIPVSRNSFDAKVSDVDWHQTFLPAFKACVDAGTYNLMCSYNSINGVPACANKKLLTDILRTEWGFKGYVISDERALERIVTEHKYSKDYVHAAADSVNAGVNLEISGNQPDNVLMNVVQAVKENLLNESLVRERVKPLFYTRMRLGEFDPPSMNPYRYSKVNLSMVESAEHRALALETAKRSFVLLKNKNNFLPINPQTHFNQIGLLGPMANNMTFLYGDYSPTVDTKRTVTPYLGLVGLKAVQTFYFDGCNDIYCKKYDPYEVSTIVKGSDIVFVCLGTSAWVEAESNDRADLELPGQQLQMLNETVQQAKSANIPVVLLLFNAGPVNVSWAQEEDGVTAIMECWFPAQSAGTALLQVLTNSDGLSSPGGRLPSTWPLYADQIPPMVNYSMMGRTYRYSDSEALYPFGYGLSYTKFEYSNLVLPKTMTAGDDLTVSFTVTNTGPVSADEVVQVYAQWINPSVPTPKLQLVTFDRYIINKGQKFPVTLTVLAKHLAVYTENNGWTNLKGTLRIYAGGQQPMQKQSVGSNILSEDITVQ